MWVVRSWLPGDTKATPTPANVPTTSTPSRTAAGRLRLPRISRKAMRSTSATTKLSASTGPDNPMASASSAHGTSPHPSGRSKPRHSSAQTISQTDVGMMYAELMFCQMVNEPASSSSQLPATASTGSGWRTGIHQYDHHITMQIGMNKKAVRVRPETPRGLAGAQWPRRRH